MSGFWERLPLDLLIATPISGSDQVHWEWQANIRNLQIPPGMKFVHMKFPEPVIDITRDKAVQYAIQSGAKWLYFLDSDVIPPPDVIPRLMAHDKPIVAGLYVRRWNPPFNEMLRFRTDGMPGLRPIMDGEYVPGSLVGCDAVATGCVLIKTEVFERMKPFEMTIDGKPARPAWFLWTEWRLPVGASEDFSFFTRAKQQGIPVYCDTSLRCRHIASLKLVPSGNNSTQIEFMG